MSYLVSAAQNTAAILMTGATRKPWLRLFSVAVLLTCCAVGVERAAAQSFAPPANYDTGTDPRFIAVGDFNGDGKPDLVAADFAVSSISVFINNGNGTFAPKVDYTTNSGPISIAVRDFNLDGKPDLAVTNYFGNNLSVFINNGNGTF